MDVISICHDKEITGVYYDKKNRLLSLTISNNEKIKFSGVVQIELNYFSDENILFDIYKYNFNDIPVNIEEDYPFLKNERFSKNYICYYLDSSSGLTGVIVCDE